MQRYVKNKLRLSFQIYKLIMKHKLFKIRAVQSEESELLKLSHLHASPHMRVETEPQNHTEMNQLMSMFSAFMKTSAKPIQVNNDEALEPRDREILIDLPSTSAPLTDSDVKRWVTDVMTKVTSSAFFYFSKGQMSFEQAKIYCSENVFKNLAILNKSHNISKQSFELIDRHVKKGVIGYLNAKYPLKETTEINKKLEKVVREVDNIETYSNNYANNLGVDFTYRQDGNYNDLIMKFINEIMSLLDSQTHDQKTNNAEFEEYMSNLFEKVEDLAWMRGDINESNFNSHSHDDRKAQDERDKYKSKVKEYTQYLIGRKISENTPIFTDKQIQNGNLKIKSSAILRILTKWCQQLQQKYYNCHYSNRSDSVKVEKGTNVNNLLAWMREEIDTKLANERKEISTFLSELSQNNYEMQSQILQIQNRIKGNEQIKLNQKICGKFAYKVVRNLHTYVIAYLNKLIHGLLKTSKKFYEENRLHTSNVWPSPPSLISFKVGDLMRCKFSSKEKEILKIYEEINRISRQNPQKLKIVRIKNRLKKGTNDILINIKFNNKILCEIQLAIKSGTSDFIKCSNMFHHYLYELQRSVFGPLTELCSIWNSLDQRTQVFRQLVQHQQFPQPILYEHTCPKLKKRFEMVPYFKPFICRQCSLTYYHNNYFRNHVRCDLCSYYLCANCHIDHQNQEDLKNILIEKEQIRNLCKKRLSQQDPFPNSGICILKESKHPQVQIFTLATYQEKDYLFGIKNGKIYEIADFATTQDKNQFRKQHLLFQFDGKQQIIPQSEAIKQYILPMMIKINFKKEKQSISLMNLGLNTSECMELLSLGSKNQKENVKHLFISDNKLEQLPFVPQEFPNLTWMSLSRNKIKSYKGIQKLPRLKQLFSIKNSLQIFPEQICQCSQLEILTLTDNSLENISQNICKLKRLRQFQCEYNPIKSIPESICECKSLVSLKFYSNPIQSLPANLHKLQNLEVLELVSVNLKFLPPQIGQLRKLRELLIFYNFDLQELPQSLINCQNLQILNINMTAISQICHFFEHWKHLKTLEAASTKIKQITPAISHLKKLQNLQISNNKLAKLPEELGELQSLKSLKLKRCGFEQLPLSFKYLKQLQLLQLENNNLHELPVDIFHLFCNLDNLNLDSCNLISLPSLSSCKILKTLSFVQNKISNIPVEHFEHLYNLQIILASQNELVILPKSILKMKKLNKLHIVKNKLTKLVEEQENPLIPPLENLTIAYLSQNCLSQIPKVLYGCTRLKELYICNNSLNFIQPAIKQLINLQQLDFSDNLIAKIPQQIRCLQNLNKLYFSSNKVEIIPKFIEHLTNLNTLIASFNPIASIECLDWILEKDIVRGTLLEIAKKFKQQQIAAAEPSKIQIIEIN